jgi:hypothetical protein
MVLLHAARTHMSSSVITRASARSTPCDDARVHSPACSQTAP